MIKEKNIAIEGKHHRPIVTDIYYKDDGTRKPLVIFCHGYKGFKDWGAWPMVAETFANHGFFFIAFNFSHNGGTLENPIDFPDLEAFGQNNFIKELDDLETVIQWIKHHNLYKNAINFNAISLIGHSRGGGIVTIKASENQCINNVISWAGVSDYAARFPQGELLEMWKKEGVAYIENGRTKQQMPHFIQFYDNFIENKERLTIKRACKELNANHLIIHGTDDITVPLSEAEALHQWNPSSKLCIIDGASHTFNSQHPYNDTILPEALQIAINKTINFITNDH